MRTLQCYGIGSGERTYPRRAAKAKWQREPSSILSLVPVSDVDGRTYTSSSREGQVISTLSTNETGAGLLPGDYPVASGNTAFILRVLQLSCAELRPKLS